MSKPAFAPTRSNSGRPQSEIARHAEEIARLWRLVDGITAKRASCEENDGDIPDGRDASGFFEDVSREALDRIHALERAVSILEPETLDDVLTLMALLGRALEFFIEAYIIEGADPNKFKFKEEERGINRLRHAVVRGLLKFASSPLICQRYFSHRYNGTPWEEELALAEAELAKLPIKCEEVLDPEDRTTHH